jgi:hypothetical protein
MMTDSDFEVWRQRLKKAESDGNYEVVEHAFFETLFTDNDLDSEESLEAEYQMWTERLAEAMKPGIFHPRAVEAVSKALEAGQRAARLRFKQKSREPRWVTSSELSGFCIQQNMSGEPENMIVTFDKERIKPIFEAVAEGCGWTGEYTEPLPGQNENVRMAIADKSGGFCWTTIWETKGQESLENSKREILYVLQTLKGKYLFEFDEPAIFSSLQPARERLREFTARHDLQIELDASEEGPLLAQAKKMKDGINVGAF